MKTAAFVGILISSGMSLLIATFLPFILSGKHWKLVQQRARTHRVREAKMNTRLLRLNL